MNHDLAVGCGQNGDQGHMSSQHDRWSTCSKREFLDLYNLLQSSNRWCLAPQSSKLEIECKNSGNYDQNSCDVWVGLGYCKGQYEKFMLDHCKKSCGGCGGVGKIYSLGKLLKPDTPGPNRDQPLRNEPQQLMIN